MPSLLWVSYRRYLAKNLWLPSLCLVAIATGVAVILGIDIASISARSSFALSTEALTGRATHSLLGAGRAVPDAVFRKLRTEWGLRRSAPVVEGYLSFPEGGEDGPTLTLLGVDPFSDGAIREWTGSRGGEQSPGKARIEAPAILGSPDRVLASDSTADRLGWKVGERKSARIGSRNVSLILAGRFTPSTPAAATALEGLLLADIATAQSLLEQDGLDRIDLVLNEAQAETLETKLPKELVLQSSGTSQRTALELSEAFHFSLQALSYLCLLVATFLIFNVVSFSVAHRRQSLGRLRVLGVTSKQLGRLLMSEALLLGALGSLLGVGLGLLLGRGLVPLVARTVNDLYYLQSITTFTIPAEMVAKAGLCGLLATLLAAALPVWWTSRSEPLELMQRVSSSTFRWHGARRCAFAGAAVLALSLLLLLAPSLQAGFLSLLGIVVGYSLMIPFGLLALSGMTRRLLTSLPNRMALSGLAAHLGRTGTAAVALTVAVAATISIAVMVSSFRQTLTVWLENTLRADVYVSSRDRVAAQRGLFGLDEKAVRQALSFPELADWSAQRIAVLPSESGETMLIGVRVGGEYQKSLRFLEIADDGWPRFLKGEGLYLTEPYARRAKKRVGDTLDISTPQGAKRYPVLGVYFSYAPDRNSALLAEPGFEKLMGPGLYSGLGLYFQPGTDLVPVASRLKGLFGDTTEVRATREIRAMALQIFERTFTVTEVLRILALGIAMMGILLSLLALGRERTTEVRILRALGFSQKELFRLSLAQSCWLGLICGLLACPLGAVLAQIMISVLNRRAFGWTIDLHLQPEAILQAVGIAVITAALAGFIPARLWSRVGVDTGLRERD